MPPISFARYLRWGYSSRYILRDSIGLPRVPFVNCCQFMYLFVSLLVLRAGYGIWLYQFRIIAYLFTFYISQLIRFSRVSSHVTDFNTRNQILTAKLLKQGYRYHKLRKTFSKFYRRHYDLVSKFNTGLKSLLKQGLSEPEFYGDLAFILTFLVHKFKKIVGRNDFSDQFRKKFIRYKRIGYNMNVMRQTACLVVNPITVNNFADLLIARRWVGPQT